jgi:hypothetical protein
MMNSILTLNPYGPCLPARKGLVLGEFKQVQHIHRLAHLVDKETGLKSEEWICSGNKLWQYWLFYLMLIGIKT